MLQQSSVTPDELRYQRENQAVFDALQGQKLLRAVYSERQLQEVLTDFWFNHFNVDARKIDDRPVMLEYERDVIRPRVFGRFRDLLGATAKSPAMLFYLDNWLSRDRGLNENYARELMELHTLGVDGGYTQADVVDVARAFTGWTMRKPHEATGFEFNDKMHDHRRQASCSARTIKAGGGVDDGERVLDLLARHPSTARFIATKLARRFVSGRSAAGAGRSRGEDVPAHRRRPARGDADDPDVAGVPGAVGAPRQGEDAVRVRRRACCARRGRR